MAYNGNSSKLVSSSFLYSTLQTFFTKIKGLLDNKADKTALNSISPSAIAAGYTNKSIYINTHPENSGAIIPFVNNDIAFLLKRGGSAKIYYDDVETSADISNVFDGSPSYWAINPTGVTKITIELTLHKTFTWTNNVYVDFGSAGWRAKSIMIDVINTNNNETTWTNKSTITNNSIGEHRITFSHNDGTGFNKIRFIFSGWNSATIFRIACLGIINYGSLGLRETFLPKDGGSVYGAITPYSNNSIDLGSSSLKWKNVYATTYNGALNGNASTSTKATQDSNGQQINTTYIKGLSVSGKTITYTKGDNTTGTITTQDTNTTYSNATTSTDGLMSANDKSKLDNIASEANKYSLPTASSSTLGGVKTTSTVTSNSGYTACPIISGVPYYKDTNTTYSLSSFGVTATAAELNALDGITATVSELNYCDGVTSNIQTQLNGKAATSHTHSYIPLSGSTSITGKLRTSDELQTTSQIRLVNDEYSAIIRNDNEKTYILLTESDDPDGTWSSLRPLTIDNNNGSVTFGCGIIGTLTGSATTLKGLTATIAELNYCDGVSSNIQYQLDNKADVTYGTSALTPGSSKLATGRVYLQYE